MCALELTRVAGDDLTGEQVLIERASRGDADAFEALVALRLPTLLRIARAILNNESDARDATQDAFVAAWQSLPTLRDARRFDAWLNTVLANKCRDLLRNRGRAHEVDIVDTDVPSADPAAGVLDRAALLAAFDRLSIADRQILALHHLEDRPLEHVARILGIPVGTAKSRLHAARRAFGRALETQA